MSVANRRCLKGKRFLLLRARKDLTPRQRVTLRDLLRLNKPLNTAYVLKEDFRAVFNEDPPILAREALKDWKHRARESGIPEIVKFVQTLNRRRYGIQNFFEHRITNSMAEGFNNVVKTVKKMAYGFHDSRYFRRKILRRCGKIE
jgi:transposase